MKVIVVGCGRFGSELAYRLYKSGHEVAIVDAIPEAFNILPVDFRGRLIEGDALNQDVLHRAGIEHAKAEGAKKPRVYKGRKPSYDRATMDSVNLMLAANESVSTIATKTGLTRQTVLRIRADPAAADEALRAWGG